MMHPCMTTHMRALLAFLLACLLLSQPTRGLAEKAQSHEGESRGKVKASMRYSIHDLPGEHKIMARAEEAPLKKEKLAAFIAIMSAIDTHGDTYSKCRYWSRQIIASQAHAIAKEKMMIRFMIGETSGRVQHQLLKEEMEKHKDIMVLPVEDSYLGLYRKVQVMWRVLSAMYEFDWLIKLDDDNFFRLDRLPEAIRQWNKKGGDYVGCFKMREFEWFGDKEKKGFDPHSGLLVPGVDDPHLYADGHFYAIRGTYIHQLSQIPLDLLRNWISEDFGAAMQLTLTTANFLDDRRMCMEECTDSTLAMMAKEAEFQHVYHACTEEDQISVDGCYEKILSDPECTAPFPKGGTLPMLPPLFNMTTEWHHFDT